MTNNIDNKVLAITLGVGILGIIGGGLIGHSIGLEESKGADIGVISCADFSDTSTPEVPPYTFTGACAKEDGTLSVPTDPASIPRCLNDDYNDGTQDRCWTEDTTGTVIIISKADKVIS